MADREARSRQRETDRRPWYVEWPLFLVGYVVWGLAFGMVEELCGWLGFGGLLIVAAVTAVPVVAVLLAIRYTSVPINEVSTTEITVRDGSLRGPWVAYLDDVVRVESGERGRDGRTEWFAGPSGCRLAAARGRVGFIRRDRSQSGAVRLALRDRTQVVLSAESPEELAAVIGKAMARKWPVFPPVER